MDFNDDTSLLTNEKGDMEDDKIDSIFEEYGLKGSPGCISVKL